MYRRACNLGLLIPYRELPSVQLIIRMAIAMALVSSDRAIEAFNVSVISAFVQDIQ